MLGPGAAALAAVWWVMLAQQTRVPCGADGSFCAGDGDGRQASTACHRVRAHLAAHLHGQETAANLLADAVCDHVENPRPSKPLVASLHGSPGIGKSYFHQLLAQGLYNATDASYDDEFDHQSYEFDAVPRHEPDATDTGGGKGGGGKGDDAASGGAESDVGGGGDGGESGGGSSGSWLNTATSYVSRALSVGVGGGFSGGGGSSAGASIAAAAAGKECPGRDCPGYKAGGPTVTPS